MSPASVASDALAKLSWVFDDVCSLRTISTEARSMPVYEYYCAACHTIYNFRVASFDTKKKPKCPDCGAKKLEKKISMFAISKGRAEGDADGDFPDIDEAAMERAMLALEGEASGLDEEDPKAMAKFMRKLYDSTGLQLGGGMEEAIRRMESGEDPDKIEAEMGDSLDDEEMLFARKPGGSIDLNAVRKKLLPPKVDETLRDL